MVEKLFTPVALGALELKHRVVMAPLTRLRSSQPGNVPNALNAEYYGQRASEGGLIIAEATNISDEARGYPGAPGIHSHAQVEGWRLVADAVHAKGGRLVMQIWHTGRISHSSMQPDGLPPFAPSPVAAAGQHMNVKGEPSAFEVPRELTRDHIARIVGDFRKAAENAKAAGMDGVEVHGANGYLIDQFLHDSSNKRSDNYGGSIENRSRFLFEVLDAVMAVWGGGRVGLRLSPWGRSNGAKDSNPAALYTYVARELDQRKLAYLHLVEPRADQRSDANMLDPNAPDAGGYFRSIYSGKIISAGGYVRESALNTVEEGRADAIAFGRSFIANPDLVERLRRNAGLNPYDRSTFYGGGAKGYTDYPFLPA